MLGIRFYYVILGKVRKKPILFLASKFALFSVFLPSHIGYLPTSNSPRHSVLYCFLIFSILGLPKTSFLIQEELDGILTLGYVFLMRLQVLILLLPSFLPFWSASPSAIGIKSKVPANKVGDGKSPLTISLGPLHHHHAPNNCSIARQTLSWTLCFWT